MTRFPTFRGSLFSAALLFTVALVPLAQAQTSGAASAPAASAEDPVAKAGALRIIRLMRFYEIFKLGTEKAINAASDTEMSPKLKACFREYTSEERISPWLASTFVSDLNDPKMVQDIAGFLESASGQKFVAFLHASARAQSEGTAAVDAEAYFSAEEKDAIGTFVGTPAGQRLLNMFTEFPNKAQKLQTDMTVDLVRYCSQKGVLEN